MACVSKWPGRRRKPYYVDYYDRAGRRRQPGFATRDEALRFLEQLAPQLRQERGLAPVARDCSLATYARQWLVDVEPSIKRRTLDHYRHALDLYLIPGLGDRPLGALRRAEVRRFLLDCRRRGVAGEPLKAASVYAIYATLRALLNAAVEDEVLPGNPALRLGRALKLTLATTARLAEIGQRALDREQLHVLLEHIRTTAAGWYPIFLTLARAGLRIGECLALYPGDYNPTAQTLRVARAWDSRNGLLGEPKHGARTVDVSAELGAILGAHIAGLDKVVTLRTGLPPAPWLFPSQAATMLEVRNVRRALDRLVVGAGLGRVVRLHDLRHTFGSQLIAAGASPVYVQRQMGHASIETTIRFYGSELPLEDRRGVDALDHEGSKRARDGGKMVARMRRRGTYNAPST
jgi:integrase